MYTQLGAKPPKMLTISRKKNLKRSLVVGVWGQRWVRKLGKINLRTSIKLWTHLRPTKTVSVKPCGCGGGGKGKKTRISSRRTVSGKQTREHKGPPRGGTNKEMPSI